MLPDLEPRAQELTEHRESFTAFLRSLNETQLNERAVEQEYSPRQTVAHFVGAETSMLRMAKNWIAQQDNHIRPDFDLNYFNQRQQEKRANQSLDALLKDWETAQRRIIELMEMLTPEDLVKRGDHPSAQDTTLGNLFLIITTHETNHIRQVMNSVHA